ncbi:MAG: nicotinamide riboside transporter PnuC [bacterium]|nr:nicotinamide riboside transporter PnuC [bacterium]
MISYVKNKFSYLWQYFTCYEKWWFSIILGLAVLIAIYFPEEDVNGVNGKIIEALYLANIFFNVLCELLIAKQSKWNFIVSLLVEATEIAIPLVLTFRFATAAVTLFFWIPIDIISFINWHKHPDQEEASLTEVRKLSGWAEFATIVGIVVWTFAIGTWTSNLNITTDLFGGNKVTETWVHYLDACVSAVGIANGLFILFRYREQWLAWYLSATLETIINILSGQYILLVLKAGYFTNTTYGYIKWTRYIKEHQEKMLAAQDTAQKTAPEAAAAAPAKP